MEGRKCSGYRLQAAYVQGYGGDVAPPTNRFYAGGESDLRGFDVRAITPYAYIPTRVLFNLTNPDGTPVPRDPQNPQLGPIQVPLPVYGIVSVGGDTTFTSNIEYRIPIAGPVTFAFFDDFDIDVSRRKSQLRQSVEGADIHQRSALWLPDVHQRCLPGRTECAFRQLIRPIYGTNLVPRMSTGRELQVILPIVNAPFRIYYAYNPLRLYHADSGRDPHHTLHVPGRRCGRLYLCRIAAALWPVLPDSRTEKDLPPDG